MRSLSWTRLALGLLLGLAWTCSAAVSSAQAPKSKTATFKTRDGVELEGTFYPSARGRDAYCVMLLHDIGSNMQQSGWDALALELQKEDFAVLAFDFRGHGGSKSVNVGGPSKPGFWNEPINRTMATKRFNPAQPPRNIDAKDFDRGYYPMLVNDIVAAKLFLDDRNDAGECNSSRVIIIGAHEGAALGLTWMVSECFRHKVLQKPAFGVQLRLDTATEAEALTAAVWLSISPNAGTALQVRTREWLELLGNKSEIPMGFLYGSQDTTSANYTKTCMNVLQANKAVKNSLTAERAINGTKLSGAGLLNKELDAMKSIVEYLKRVREERKGPAWKAKKTNEIGYFWMIRGQPIEAKGEKEDVMNLVPLRALLGG